jgi:DNA-binding transcriptional regulator YiaG
MKKYKSEASKALHEVAEAMNKAGIIPDERMREFDRSHLVKSAPAAPAAAPKSRGGTRSGAPVYMRGK